MKLNREIELLAPAGNMESLVAAVAAGCDAVYLGGTLFSARAFAGNFNHEMIVEAISYCHIRDVKVYVTMNTILYEDEMNLALDEVEFLYEHDVDAIIVQDFGLFHALRQCFPDLEVHCSTQMHVHNLNGIRFMKEQGASRIVLARETPIEIIQEACKLGIEIEVFAYGAICVSYSGQCLMSQSLKNRSGNRGKCAQLCRMKYTTCEDNGFHKNSDGDYLLSPKDLNEIDQLAYLLDAGVHSIKIEGRMKRPEYVWLVVKTFREAIDAYKRGKCYRLSDNRKEALLLMFNRGFSTGHTFHSNVENRMNHHRPNHQGIQIGEVIRYDRGRVFVKLTKHLNQHDGLRIINAREDIGINAGRIWKNSLLVNHADAGDQVWIECPEGTLPQKGDALQKTTDIRLIQEIQKNICDAKRTTEIKISCQGKIAKPLILTIEDTRGNRIEKESNQLCQKAINAPISNEKMVDSLSKSAEFPYDIKVVDVSIDHIFIPVRLINETRRIALEELSRQREIIHKNRKKRLKYRFSLSPKPLLNEIMLVESNHFELSLPQNAAQVSQNLNYFVNQNIWKKRPVIYEGDNQDFKINHAVLSQIGDMYHPGENCIAGMNFHITNSYAIAFFISFSKICGIVLSSELNEYQIQMMLEAFRCCHGFLPSLYRLRYGRRTLMYIKEGVTNHDHSIKSIRDVPGNIFPTEMDSGVFHIYENRPVKDYDSLKIGSYLIFTIEDKHEAKQIQEEYYEEVSTRI